MSTTIDKQDKKIFIRWLLKNHSMKRRECVWILNYLLSHDHLLSNVHFVEDSSATNRGMVMSTTGSESIPFRFYKGNLMTADAEKSFHDLRLHPDDKMYIQINFPDMYHSSEYLAVLEDVEVKLSNKEGVIEVSEEIEMLVGMITASNSRVSLMSEIDKALDNGDEELFMQLSGMLMEQKELKAISFSA